MVRGYVDKEKRIDADHEEELDKLRLYYIGKLQEKRNAATEAGLASQTRAIDNEIESCGTTGSSLLEHFSSEL